MKVICIDNTAQNLDLTEVIDITNHEHRYALTMGAEYMVMGTVMYKKSRCLYYLVDHEDLPQWVPHLLFDIVDNSIPPSWYTKTPDTEELKSLSFLMGFDELCNYDGYYNLLLAKDDIAIMVYFERKEQIENELYKKYI